MTGRMLVSSMDVDNSPEKRPTKTIRKLVPWETPELFLKVYRNLYSPEVTKKRWAVDELAVWESRCYPSLGTAIEASMVITRAIIQDVLMSNGTSFCQEKEIQMMYAMALIRFVNLSVELHQSDTKQATAGIAKSLGIPSWIVDLRNEASHSFLPSLEVLRMGADRAMQYLDKEFWSVEVSNDLRMVKNEPFNYDTITELIFLFRTRQYHIITTTDKTEDIIRDIEDVAKILEGLRMQIYKNRKQVFEILLEDGIFIPSELELKGYLTHAEQTIFNNSCEDSHHRQLLNDNEKTKDKEDKSKGNKLTGDKSREDESEEDKLMDDEKIRQALPDVPQLLKKLWSPLLNIMNEYHAIPEFVESLLFTQHWRYPVGQKILLSWVMQILLLHPEHPSVKKDAVRRIFTEGNAIFDWNRLLYAAIAFPCKYTIYIIPQILAHLNLKKEHVHYVMCLLAISQGLIHDEKHKQSGRHSDPDEHRTFSLQDLTKLKALQEKKKREKKKLKNLESLFDDCFGYPDLKTYPIGYNFCTHEEEDDSLDGSYEEDEELENKDCTEKSIFINGKDKEMKITIKRKQNTFEDDKIIMENDNFLYKKRR